uniref:DUF834 domain-containing protein n=1 Tax=Oryza glaberrima TaxID=4538 RepID=I1Q8S9_ORYGL
MAAGGRRGSGARRRQWRERRERRQRERRERHTPSTVTHLHHHRRVRSWQRTAGAAAAALTVEDGDDVEAGALVRDSGGEVGPLLRGQHGGCPLHLPHGSPMAGARSPRRWPVLVAAACWCWSGVVRPRRSHRRR